MDKSFILGTFIAINLLFNIYSIKSQSLDHTGLVKPNFFSLDSMVRNMNLEADPCEDFFEHVCGGYVKTKKIPLGFNSWNSFTQNDDDIKQILYNILENSNTSYPSEGELYAKQLFDGCLDPQGIREKRGSLPLLNYLKVYKGWDFMNPKLKTSPFISRDTQSGLLKIEYDRGLLQEDYVDIFIDLNIGIDPKNSSAYLPIISPGKLTLPNKDMYKLNADPENFKMYQAYKKYMTNLLYLLIESNEINPDIGNIGNNDKYNEDDFSGNEVSLRINLAPNGTTNSTQSKPQSLRHNPEIRKKVDKIIDGILTFETLIANFTPSPKDLYTFDEENYIKLTMDELNRKYDFMNWTRFLNLVFSPYNNTLTANDTVWVRSVDHLGNLTRLLKSYLNSPNKIKILNDYGFWHMANPMTSLLSTEFRKAYEPVQRAVNKKDYENLPKWKKCLKEFPVFMQYPLSALYLRDNFDKSDRKRLENLVTQLQKAYKQRINDLKWMDAETKIKAQDKVDALKIKIGFPDYIVTPALLDKDYAKMPFEPNKYFENWRTQNQRNNRNVWKRYKAPIDKTKWYIPPHSVNAYYLASQNEIVFLAGIFRNPFYDRLFPISMSYGSIGSVIGHEITHGFDDDGRKYDKNGNVNPWWSDASIAAFENKTQCFINQYNNYSIGNHKLNGKQTVGEDLADNGGVAISFKAFSNIMPEKERKVIYQNNPYNFTNEQLFFIAFGQAFCSKDKPERIYLQIKTDFHTVPKYRINGALSNSKDFARAFNCSANAFMNRQDKCKVW